MPAAPPPNTGFNQPPPLEDVNLFTSNLALKEAVEREGAGTAVPGLEQFGRAVGAKEALEQGRLADRTPPRLETHDRYGHRIDRVELSPAYHASMALSCAEGLHASAWDGYPAPFSGAHVARAAGLYMAVQMEAGHCAALSMTNASVAGFLKAPDYAKTWLPKIQSRDYDPSHVPTSDKPSATVGLAFAERQSGTDMSGTITQAVPKGSSGNYVLIGHKWFLSAPMSDAFMVLAQARGGLSCFLLPRYLPGGAPNGLHLVRLKELFGSRSSGTAEAELNASQAWLIGEEGQGAALASEMLLYTRLDHAVMAAGLMRAALANAIHYAEHRSVRDRSLARETLMMQVLADIALDVEAAIGLTFRLARAFDRMSDGRAAAWCHLMTPVTKYWTTKIAQWAVAEAMECLGGQGYVEDTPLPRIARDLPAHAIADGPGNVMALEVLAVLRREPESVSLVMEDLAEAARGDAGLEAAHARIETMLQEPRWLDQRARALTESLAVLAAGTILRAHGPSAVADAFIATRALHATGRTYGQGIDSSTAAPIIARARPGNGGSST
jgi:putative acyl-CoA dehydrogenase